MRWSWFLVLAACGGKSDLVLRDTASQPSTSPSTSPSTTSDTTEPSTSTDCPIWYADADGDDWGDAAVTMQSCDPPTGWLEFAGDCDDADPEENPDSERKVDGTDSNCDGKLDWLVDVWVTADDAFELCIDGDYVGDGGDWTQGYLFQVWMDSGEHVVGIKGWDTGYVITAAIGHIETTAGDRWVTDGSWRYDPSPDPAFEDVGWCTTGFDASAWLGANVIGPIGTPPWGGCPAPCGFPAGSPAQWIWDDFPVALNTQYLRKPILLP